MKIKVSEKIKPTIPMAPTPVAHLIPGGIVCKSRKKEVMVSIKVPKKQIPVIDTKEILDFPAKYLKPQIIQTGPELNANKSESIVNDITLILVWH